MFGNQTLLCQVVLPVRSCAAAIRLDRERTWRARPGGNATGFMLFEFSLSGKMAGTAQADRAARGANGSPSGSDHCYWDRPV